MDSGDFQILDAVVGVVNRYGIKRSTMDELSRHAGVSRQTLYDRYGGKDGVMAAAIDMIATRILAELTTAFSNETTLGARIDAYFNIAVRPIFEALRSMPDAADLEKGMGPRSTEAGQKGAKAKQKLLEEVFAAHLSPNGPPPGQVAMFFEQSCSRAKMSGITPDEFEQFLSVLKASILALANGADAP